MRIGIPREALPGETRVAGTPKTVEQLIKLGFEVMVEHDAGKTAYLEDNAYATAGATLVDREKVWDCPIIFKVNPPSDAALDLIKPGTILISFFWPALNAELLQKLQDKKISVLAMDMVPRLSRAQAMDALSSMANISGYRAVIEAASEFGRFFTGQITAAGRVPPAEVLVIGAGVAGLSSIGAAMQLGAIVKAFDTRLEVAEQIESMGGEFLKLDLPVQSSDSGDGYATTMSDEFIAAEMKLFAEQAQKVDIIITTAAIPGKPAPVLITKEMVDSMKPGSVIVDLAAPTGGNCEYTVADKMIVTENGVKVIGYTDIVNRLPGQASQLYSTNLVNLAKLMTPNKDGEMQLDFEDAVIRNMTLTHDGDLMYPPPAIQVSAAASVKKKPAPIIKKEPPKPVPLWKKLIPLGVVALLFLWMGANVPAAFLNHMIVFVLSCVVGYYVVWNVTHSLHTPLMSVTNAISGIIVVGALLQIGHGSWIISILSFIAVLIASINIFGGFYVTRRMLEMFRKDNN